jgi:hypothetical protein
MSGPFYEIGRYACKVTNQALGEAKTGTPQFILQFTVMGKVDPSDPSRYIPGAAQYERTHYRAITDKTIQYFLEDLKILGFKGASFKELDPSNSNFHDFRGQDVDMWCGHENGQDGKPREKWGVARVGSTLEVKPIEPKKLRDLDNLFGKQLKTLSATPGTRPAPVNAAPPAMEITDDDVPFMRYDVPCL